ERAIARGERIAWPGAEGWHEPFLNRDLDGTFDDHRWRRRFHREMGGEVGCRRIGLIFWQRHHRSDQLIPAVLGVAPGIANEVEPVAFRARRLHQFLAGAVGELHRWWPPSLPASGCGEEREPERGD